MKSPFAARHIEDYVLVTIITLVIWFYAESQTLETYTPTNTGAVALTLKAASEDRVVTSQSVKRVATLEFRGSRYRIGKLKSRLSGGLELKVGGVEPGSHTRSLSGLIAEEFEGLNVSVTRVDPERIDFEVEQLVTKEVELRFNSQGVTLQDGAAEIVPAKVSVRLPESLAGRLETDGQAVLMVESTVDPRTLRRNTKLKVAGRVELPETLRNNTLVEVTPREVEVSLVIEAKEATHTIPSLFVEVAFAIPSDQKQFEAIPVMDNGFLYDVKLTGPADVIEGLSKLERPIIAYVRLTTEMLTEAAKSGQGSFPVEFLKVPQGVTVSSSAKSVVVQVTRIAE